MELSGKVCLTRRALLTEINGADTLDLPTSSSKEASALHGKPVFATQARKADSKLSAGLQLRLGFT